MYMQESSPRRAILASGSFPGPPLPSAPSRSELTNPSSLSPHLSKAAVTPLSQAFTDRSEHPYLLPLISIVWGPECGPVGAGESVEVSVPVSAVVGDSVPVAVDDSGVA